MRYVSGTKLDDRIIRTDWDMGFEEGRQFGRGKSGGQVCVHVCVCVQCVCVFVFRCAMTIGQITTRIEEVLVGRLRNSSSSASLHTTLHFLITKMTEPSANSQRRSPLLVVEYWLEIVHA